MPQVKVNFKSAKLCLDNARNTSDVVWRGAEGYTTRQNFVDFEKPIIFEPISNMMHVLFGDRPSSTFNNNGNSQRIAHIDEIVRNGFYKIDNDFSYYDKNGKLHTASETTHGKKLPWDANNTVKTYNKLSGKEEAGFTTWSYLKNRYYYQVNAKKCVEGTEKARQKYDNFVALLEEIYGSNIFNEDGTANISLVELLNKIGEEGGENKAKVVEYLNNNQMKPLLPFVGEVATGSFNCNNNGNRAALMINQFVLAKVSFNGSFVFNVTDEEYEMLKKGPRFATYLDGGVASIEFLGSTAYTEEELTYDYNYNKISEL